jgi:hypothetical protein
LSIALSDVIGKVREPLRAYNFEVILPSDFASPDIVRRLTYQVQDVSLPIFDKIDTENYFPAYGRVMQIPARWQDFDLSITFWESDDKVVMSYFQKWIQSMLIDTDIDSGQYRYFKPLKEFRKNVEVWFLNLKGERAWGVKCLECYPTSAEQLRLDYARSDLLTITVNFAVTAIERVTNVR